MKVHWLFAEILWKLSSISVYWSANTASSSSLSATLLLIFSCLAPSTSISGSADSTLSGPWSASDTVPSPYYFVYFSYCSTPKCSYSSYSGHSDIFCILGPKNYNSPVISGSSITCFELTVRELWFDCLFLSVVSYGLLGVCCVVAQEC